jgi:hypothetical protein
MRLVGPLFLAVLLAALPAAGQTVVFGSSHDPLETTLEQARRGAGRIAAYGGPSYVGVRWRTALGLEAEGSVGPVALGLEGVVRGGLGGIYAPDFGEPYDGTRVLRYARFNPTERFPVYARVGPIQRVTLGSGLLVRDFATTATWDERTVGAEAAVAFPFAEVAGFAGDLRMNGLVGGHVRIRPAGMEAGVGLPSLEFTLSAVHDLGVSGDRSPTGAAAEASLAVYALSDLQLRPFVAAARYLHYGDGLAAGATFGSRDLGELGRLGLLAALAFSSEGFFPGYVSAFYPVFNPEARIVDSDAYFRDRSSPAVAGSPLEAAPGGVSLLLEFDLALLGAVEFSPYLRRDFGGTNGAFGLRLGLVPDRGRDLRFRFEIHRQGLDGFTDLFSDLVDEALLDFHVDYRVTGPVSVFLRSRYGYRRVGDAADGTARYLVERRFEPLVGVSLLR